jgi:hypothetical protein
MYERAEIVHRDGLLARGGAWTAMAMPRGHFSSGYGKAPATMSASRWTVGRECLPLTVGVDFVRRLAQLPPVGPCVGTVMSWLLRTVVH